MQTAFVHPRPGGAAVFTPDFIQETFAALRCLEWMWDPDPNDTAYRADYSFLLRDGDQMQAVHDPHTVGLFPRQTWVGLLSEVGFEAEPVRRPIGGGETDEIFVCRRPV